MIKLTICDRVITLLNNLKWLMVGNKGILNNNTVNNQVTTLRMECNNKLVYSAPFLSLFVTRVD